MKCAVMIAAAVAIALIAFSSAVAQDRRSAINECVTSLIRVRIEAQQPVQLSAETVTLTGDTLHLTGRALIRFNDMSIRAEEIVLNQTTKRIDLVGNVHAFLGSSSICGRPPRIEFR